MFMLGTALWLVGAAFFAIYLLLIASSPSLLSNFTQSALLWMLVFGGLTIFFLFMAGINLSVIRKAMKKSAIVAFGIGVALPPYPDLDLPFFAAYMALRGVPLQALLSSPAQYIVAYSEYMWVAVLIGLTIAFYGFFRLKEQG